MKLWQQQTVEVDDKNKKISLQQNFHSANGLTLGYCADYGVSPEMRIGNYRESSSHGGRYLIVKLHWTCRSYGWVFSPEITYIWVCS